MSMSKIKMVHVPYKSGGAVFIAVQSGEISRERIDQALLRVLTAKQVAGLIVLADHVERVVAARIGDDG